MRAFLTVPVLVGALGYFVDVFDLMIFSVVRPTSLASLGVAPGELLPVGARLLNFQLAGLLAGGFLWGALSDRYGRKVGLYGSILLYSLANVANAFVTTPDQYAICRLLAGVGLAGELGVAVTLVCESLPLRYRSHGATLVVGMGLFGAIFAALVGDHIPWRGAYGLGGGMGLLLLSLRLGLPESPMFLAAAAQPRSSPLILFSSMKRVRAYLGCVLVGLPIWFVVAILATFAPELGKALGLADLGTGPSVLSAAIGVTLGNFLFGFLSHQLRSRKRAVSIGLASSALVGLPLAWLLSTRPSAAAWHLLCFFLALTNGYGGVLFTMSAEMFGTNLRALVASSVPNLVRGSAVVTVALFLRGGADFGTARSALGVGLLCLLIAGLALPFLDETYHRDLNFSES